MKTENNMEITIKKLLEKRAITPLGKGVCGDSWVGEILSELPERAEIIVPLSLIVSIIRDKNIKTMFEIYNVIGLFDLSNPFFETSMNLILVVLNKSLCKSVVIGKYNNAFIAKKHERPTSKGELSLYNFPKEFEVYCSEIEKWLKKGELPVDNDVTAYEFNIIPSNEFQRNHIYPNYYTKSICKGRELLKKEKTVKLQNIAEILHSGSHHIEKVKVISIKDMKYPLETSKISEGLGTSQVKKYDIVIKSGMLDKIYLIYDDIDEEIFIGRSDFIIRPKDKESSTYLYLYFTSEIGQIIIVSLCLCSWYKRLSLNDLKELPVIVPNEQEFEHYKKLFVLNHYKVADIQSFYEVTINDNKSSNDIISMIYSELSNRAKLYKPEALRTFLIDDFKEVCACYSGKAYKAATIMCGSILEAVLIDWVSELHNKNYFYEDCIVLDNKGKDKKADLYDYIKIIKSIDPPKWKKDEAFKADFIRDKRNRVHAKLCMKYGIIDKEKCKKVIEYLFYVLESRGLVFEPAIKDFFKD